jgi:hypothetical protein
MEITTGKHAAAAEAMRETASGRPRGDGDEAEPVAALKLADGDEQAEAGKGKRIGKVSQKYIDIVLNEKATGTGAYRKRTATESYKKYVETCTSPRKEELRALMERGEAVIEQLRAGDDDILEQYHPLGYAYTELEEDNSFIYDEKIFGPIARRSRLL